MKVNYSTDFRWQTPTVMPNRIDVVEYAQIRNEAALMENGDPVFSDGQIDTDLKVNFWNSEHSFNLAA